MSAVAAFSTTDVERSVDSAIEAVLNRPDGMFTLTEEQTTALVFFVASLL